VIRIGIIGCGHWGPNHIRVFNQQSDTQVKTCADLDEKRLGAIHANYPAVTITRDYRDILKDPDIDTVCISTPTSTHFSLSREALEAGKNVFCEKPLAMKAEECQQLEVLAAERKKILMVGHVFVFNKGIVKTKEYLQSGELGKIHYAHSERTNLGPFRYDVNALWDLAPHDISIFNYLFDSCPVNVSARGQRCLGNPMEDLAFASLQYPGDIFVNVHVSWLDPRKVRQITLVGEKKMLLWDDLDNVGPVRLYDKYVEKTARFYETYGEFQLLSREGSITIPHVTFEEPLKSQASYFLDCVRHGKNPDRADAKRGADVVRTLCAIQQSMGQGGASVDIK